MKKLMNKKISLIIISTLLLLSMTAVLIDIPAVYASSQLILRPNVDGTYQQFTEFPTNPIALIQGHGTEGNGRGTGSSSPISVTLSQTPAQGDVLIATITANRIDATVYVSSITQAGVTWSAAYAYDPTGPSLIGYLTEIWVGVVGSGASTSISVAFNNNQFVAAVVDVCEFSGIASNQVDQVGYTFNTVGTVTNTGTTPTTTQPYELWIGCTASSIYAQSSPTNGFTLLDGALYTASNGYTQSTGFLYKIVNSTGAANTGTTLSGSYNWQGCIATFEASSPLTHAQATSDQNDATGVQVTGSTSLEETELLAIASQTGPISSVEVHMRAKALTTGLYAHTLCLTHGTLYDGSATSIATTFTDYDTVYSTNPNTGNAWTWAEVNALEVGVKQQH